MRATGSCVAPLGPAIFDYTANGVVQDRAGNHIARPRPTTPSSEPLTDGGRPMDERWVAIACFSDDEWQSLAEPWAHPTGRRTRSSRPTPTRKENEDELDADINAWTADKDPYEVMHDLQPGASRRRRPERPRAAGRRRAPQGARLLQVPRPRRDRPRAYDGPPFSSRRRPANIHTPAPLLGEHTEYVCKEILGLSDDEIAELMVAGALT